MSTQYPIVLTRYIRRLRGGSQPILAEANDGRIYVVKFSENIQGSNLLFNECMGTELYLACGLPVAPWKLIRVTNAFLDQNHSCWIQTPEGTVRPSSGACFGSLFLGNKANQLYEILPKTYFERVKNRLDFWASWLIDICASHDDNRQSIFRVGHKKQLEAVFIDHGHMFGGPKGERDPNFMVSRYLDLRIYEKPSESFLQTLLDQLAMLNVNLLWNQSRKLPDEWKIDLAINNFAKCLDRISDNGFLQSVLTMIMGSHHQAGEYEQFYRIERNCISSDLHTLVCRKRVQQSGVM